MSIVMARVQALLLITLLSNPLSFAVSTAETNSELGHIRSVVAVKRSTSAIFAFGDATLDAGTNNLFPSIMQADLSPYGDSFFNKPTGRFSNGRTIVDYLAHNLMLPFPKPYLKRDYRLDMLDGVNYASAGSGVFPQTGAHKGVISFPDQFKQFNYTLTAIAEALGTVEKATEYISRSIVLICVGLNDMSDYAQSHHKVYINDFLERMMEAMQEQVGVAYRAGARKFVFLGLPPMGCLPAFVAQWGMDGSNCYEPFNDFARVYNIFMRRLVVEKLPEVFEGIHAVMANPYYLMHLLIHENAHGFIGNTTACCGSGRFNAETRCGISPNLISNEPFNVCDEVEKYVFWDFFHYTEKVNEILALGIWEGEEMFVAPMNLRQLAEL